MSWESILIQFLNGLAARVGLPNDRLKQNSLAEKITAGWLRHCMPELRKQTPFV